MALRPLSTSIVLIASTSGVWVHWLRVKMVKCGPRSNRGSQGNRFLVKCSYPSTTDLSEIATLPTLVVIRWPLFSTTTTYPAQVLRPVTARDPHHLLFPYYFSCVSKARKLQPSLATGTPSWACQATFGRSFLYVVSSSSPCYPNFERCIRRWKDEGR